MVKSDSKNIKEESKRRKTYLNVLERLRYCTCPPPETFDDIVVKPVKPSPADFLGFKRKCCGCVKLKLAAIIICIISFIWAAYELQTAEKFISKIFPNEKLKQVMNITKIIYILCIVVFVFATGLFLLGIIMKKYGFVHAYVWCAFMFVCSCAVLSVAALTVQIIAGTGRKATMNIVFAVIWYSLFIYFVTVVNSYKMTLW